MQEQKNNLVIPNPAQQDTRSENPFYDPDQLIVNHFAQAPSEHPILMGQLQKYPTLEEQNRTRILSNTKVEINILLQMSESLDRVTPLIYEEEHVVEHLQRIEEYFEELQDNLSEVRDYMVALLEYVMENDDANIRTMVPQLEKIISLLREICPPNEMMMMMSTPGGMTPTPMYCPSEKTEITADPNLMLSPIVLGG